MVYLDYAASGPLLPEVLQAMLPVLTEHFGNPSGVHAYSRVARDYLESSREEVAASLGVSASEIVFTSGGTEANALAILGHASTRAEPGHIITTAIEHPSVTQAVANLKKTGHEVTVLMPDRTGLIGVETVGEAIRGSTFLVSMMLGSNEIGTLQPFQEVAELCDQRGIAYHCDGVQGVGKVPINLGEVPLSTLSLSAHKFGGPKGIGALFVRRGHSLKAITPGGGQEHKLRSGTQNVSGAVGLGRAISLAVAELATASPVLQKLRDYVISQLCQIPEVSLTGHASLRLPHIASFILEKVDGESLIVFLDARGICASTGSACSSGTLQASPTLLACGLTDVEARGSLRLSVGRETRLEDLLGIKEAVLDALTFCQ